MDLKKQEIDGKNSQKGDSSVAPEPGAPTAATRHFRRIPFLTAFTTHVLRFEGHLSCSVLVLRGGSISGQVWYGLLELIYTILSFLLFLFAPPRSGSGIERIKTRKESVIISNIQGLWHVEGG